MSMRDQVRRGLQIQESVVSESKHPIVYHATVGKRLPMILQKGLQARSSVSSMHGRPAVFVTRNPEHAAAWVRDQKDPVVLAIDSKHPSLQSSGADIDGRHPSVTKSLTNHGYVHRGRDKFSEVYEHPEGHRVEVQVAHFQDPVSYHWRPGAFNPERHFEGRKQVRFNKLPDYLDTIHKSQKSVKAGPQKAKFFRDPEYDLISSELGVKIGHPSSFEVAGSISPEAIVRTYRLNDPTHRSEFDQVVQSFRSREFKKSS